MPDSPVIAFEDVSYRHGQAAVLGDVSFALAAGGFVVLLGPSGAGKTTLLRLVTREILPASGTVRVFGRDFARADAAATTDLRRALGVVPQTCHFLDHLSLEENIALPLRICGFDLAARRGDIAALLDWVDLRGREGLRPGDLSEGERRRAALARAVILSPDLLLVDDLTGAVDRAMALRLLTLLVELNRMGKTVLLATHDAEVAQALADQAEVQILGLDAGRLLAPEAAA